MSIQSVVRHIQRILNQCGDPVSLRPTGRAIPVGNGQILIEIEDTYILRKNNCCALPEPSPSCIHNSEDSYCVNRIRIGMSTIDDYTKNYPFTDDVMREIICSKAGLFGCYSNP